MGRDDDIPQRLHNWGHFPLSDGLSVRHRFVLSINTRSSLGTGGAQASSERPRYDRPWREAGLDLWVGGKRRSEIYLAFEYESIWPRF
jgi:hypothetical protein